ncbi:MULTISPECIES: DMT family transporter [Pirellulaceae]|uniref:Transporter family-2 protein n=1 Tax=Aporhodopirellula rubra TaxID=980271 RepID=A0A7W5E058_9BACT|nr:MULTISPECIES: DMT family transporter [Pirellulaceae]MBB3207690.1 transporter family-2 protein [Aporhodopirellula rubra]
MSPSPAGETGWMTLAVVIGLFAGGILAIQPSANGMLGRYMHHPLHASLYSFGSGFVIVLVISLVCGILPPRMSVSPTQLPFWAWIGGAIGVVLVTSSLVLVPRVGSLPWFAAVMTGQTLLAMLLDHYGWLGNPRVPATPLRVLGVTLLILGVLAIVFAKRGAVAESIPPSEHVDTSITKTVGENPVE